MTPSLSEQLRVWDREYDWSLGGDEWSGKWGGTEALWHGTLLPRISPYVPAGTVLEIAPGHGRCSQFLEHLAERLVLVDISESCIEACRKRFAGSEKIEFHVNDGRSLDAIADRSVDFAFSFDSLVHVEGDVLEAYLGELARTLAADGVAFIHHSNLGALRVALAIATRVPDGLRAPLAKAGLIVDLSAWRAMTVSADGFAALCRRAGLSCISQELINWSGGPHLIDAFSVVTRSGSRWERDRAVVRNRAFRREAERVRRLYASEFSPA
jgi:SAM-dependent methyltransferase